MTETVENKRWTIRKWMSIVGGFIVFVALIIVGLSVYVGWSLTHPEREDIESTPQQFGMSYEDIQFVSQSDKLQLKGWYIPAKTPNGMTIIVAHGYRKNRTQDDVPLLQLAKALSDRGYRLVLFDMRNSGESAGELTSVGQFEKLDVLGAIDYVKLKLPTDKIALLGYSMGAVTSMLAAAESPDVVAIVADSAFSNLNKYLEDNLSVWSGLPDFPFTSIIMYFIPPATGTNPEKVNPLQAVEQIYPRPILFIHGKADDAIPYAHSVKLQAKYPDTFELWLTEGAGHVGSYKLNASNYVNKIDTFLQKSMK